MQITAKNILFMGTSDFAAGILKNILEQGVTVKAVITQPDKKTGRKQLLTSPPVKKFATEQGLAIRQYEKIDKEALADIESLHPDIIIVAAYGIILPKKLLSLPTFGCLNVHGSLLPRHRGASPIQTALSCGDKSTGTTIMVMDEGVDTGPLLNQSEVTINPNDNFFDLQAKLISSSNKILLPTIEKYLKKEIVPQPQDDATATHTKLIKKEDGLIDWTADAQSIYNKYRAFKAWPLIYTYFKDKEKSKKLILNEIVIGKIEELLQPGQVAKIEEKIVVGTGSGTIVLKELTLEGSKKSNVADFINGKPHFIKTVLFSKNS